ncbi:hypothetical protein [Nonomuraea sp. SYSU D8015]|nr:hypothetical protein [Nonomuraea sp. SYSU D8015]
MHASGDPVIAAAAQRVAEVADTIETTRRAILEAAGTPLRTPRNP